MVICEFMSKLKYTFLLILRHIMNRVEKSETLQMVLTKHALFVVVVSSHIHEKDRTTKEK